jgi:ATP-binding cassette subfamily B protein
MTAPMLITRRSRPPQQMEKPTWKERLAAARYIGRFVAMVWSTDRRMTTAMIVLRLVRSMVPVATLWVGKQIVDGVVGASRGTFPVSQLWKWVAIELGIVAVGEMLARGSALTESLLGDKFGNRMSVRLMEHAATLDLQQFEDPAFYDHLERARRSTTGRLGLLAQLLQMAQDALTLLSLSTALVVASPWLVLLLVVAILPSFLGETHFARLAYSLLFRWTPERRELDYIRYVGASDRTAKEVQMLGLAPWLTERYRELADRYYHESARLAIRKAGVSTALSLLGTVGYYGAYVVIILRTVSGAITIGTLTFLAGAFQQSRGLLQRILLGASDIYEQSLYLRDLFVFFEMQPTIYSKPAARAVPQPIREGFVFEDVGFRYPGSERWAIRHVSFALMPGERIALVGENGAGKTTITKLLARLYDPTEGRILLDGVDLREYDLLQLRHAIGVIFQDFVRYDMRFDENVGVGEIDEMRAYLDAERGAAVPKDGSGTRQAAGVSTDGSKGRKAVDVPGEGSGTPQAAEVPRDGSEARGPVDVAPVLGSVAGREGVVVSEGPLPPESLVSATEKSLAASLLPRLPSGYRQMLGRRFEEGVDLSGGEWQKVALARAYMREAQVLILDEPTAALDARAEYDVFVRFNQLMAGRMAVVISHRFSTVRMADRIIVLRGGEVVEEGTHDELVARGGLYAELFQMQAAGYR